MFMPKYDGVIYKRYNGTSWDIINFAPAPHTHSEYLPKITYEWNKEFVNSFKGYCVIGPFYCDYSTIILEITGNYANSGNVNTIRLNIRTSGVANNTVSVTATEHLTVSGKLPNVYQLNNTVTIVYGVALTGATYSVHIKALNLASAPDETNLFTLYPSSELPDFSGAHAIPINRVLYEHTVTGTPRLGETTASSRISSFNNKNYTGFYYAFSGAEANPINTTVNCLVINYNNDFINNLVFPQSNVANNPQNIRYRVQWYDSWTSAAVLGDWQQLAFIKDVNSTVNTAIQANVNNLQTKINFINLKNSSTSAGTLTLGGGSIVLSNGMTLNLADDIHYANGNDQNVTVSISVDEYTDDGGHIWFALVDENDTMRMNSTESIYEGQELDDMINNGSEDTGYCIKVFGCADTSDYMVTNKNGEFDLDNLYEGVSLLATITYDNDEQVWRIVS
jgi:hypothetical protein